MIFAPDFSMKQLLVPLMVCISFSNFYFFNFQDPTKFLAAAASSAVAAAPTEAAEEKAEVKEEVKEEEESDEEMGFSLFDD